MNEVQTFVTSLGDLFPASCVAAGVAVWCWFNLNRLLALAFAASVAGAVALTVWLKTVSASYAPTLADASSWSLSRGAPSGHAVSAAVVYGCVAAVFVKACRGASAWAGAAYCLAVITAVCVTRLTLHAHTLGDVAAGIAVAAGFVALYARALEVQLKPAAAPAGGLIAIVVIVGVLALASGVRISSEQFL